jgi:hypothetical protein
MEINPPFHDGYCYFLTDNNLFYVDYEKNNIQYREPLSTTSLID